MSWAVDGLEPSQVWQPRSVGELLEMVGRAQSDGHSIIPWGGGTHMGLGGVPSRYDVALSTAHLKSVLTLQPDDLVVTVEAGLTLQALDAVVAAHGLRLPLDPPYPERATVGGVLAANSSGPYRHSFGTPRDLVLGVKVAMSDGRPVKGGGQVVKNVSGYDLVRLMVGSLGTLGVIFEATFKLLPRPACTRWVEIPCSGDGEVWLNRLMGREFQLAALELYRHGELKLLVGLEGERSLVDAQSAAIGGTEVDRYPWLRDHALDSDRPLILKVAVLPADVVGLVEGLPSDMTVLGAAGVGVLRVFCPQATADAVRLVREQVHALGGTVTVERAPAALKREVDVWDAVGDSLPWMRTLKQTLDPRSTFSPGRFVDGL